MSTQRPLPMLDGSSHASALSTVAALLGTSVEIYRDSLRATRTPDVWQDIDACFEGALKSLARLEPDVTNRAAGLPRVFPCAWFHASRVIDPQSFCRRGILPLASMRAELDATLESMTEGLETDGGDSGFGLSYAAKQDSTFDGGPHAFLLRSAAVLAPGATHQFMRTPEYVEDVAGLRLGGNGGQLELRFRRASTPCLVKFRGVAGLRHLQRVIVYGLAAEQGLSDEDAASIANTCMAPDGEAVPPERIIAVETFPREAFGGCDDARFDPA